MIYELFSDPESTNLVYDMVEVEVLLGFDFGSSKQVLNASRQGNPAAMQVSRAWNKTASNQMLLLF